MLLEKERERVWPQDLDIIRREKAGFFLSLEDFPPLLLLLLLLLKRGGRGGGNKRKPCALLPPPSLSDNTLQGRVAKSWKF